MYDCTRPVTLIIYVYCTKCLCLFYIQLLTTYFYNNILWKHQHMYPTHTISVEYILFNSILIYIECEIYNVNSYIYKFPTFTNDTYNSIF